MPPVTFRSPVSPLQPGNLPTQVVNRVRNRDGSVSTVRTMSIGVDGGEVLIPTVIGGKVVSDEQAIRHYERTGENFGTFATPQDATAYAKALHEYHAKQIAPKAETSYRGDFNPVSTFRQAGFTPTSGYRTQRHQDSLVAQGLTKTRSGSHQRGDGLDFGIPQGWSKQQAIAWVRQQYPGARAIPSNGNAIHVTFPGWGKAPDVSGSRSRYGGK